MLSAAVKSLKALNNFSATPTQAGFRIPKHFNRGSFEALRVGTTQNDPGLCRFRRGEIKLRMLLQALPRFRTQFALAINRVGEWFSARGPVRALEPTLVERGFQQFQAVGGKRGFFFFAGCVPNTDEEPSQQ